VTEKRHIILTTHAQQRLRRRLPHINVEEFQKQIERRVQRGDWVSTQGGRFAVKVEHDYRYAWAVIELLSEHRVRVVTVLKPGWRIDPVVPATG